MKNELRKIKKAGYVAIIGRPNAGKSTLLNTILGQKVTVTSPRPQTTRTPIEAVYEDERGQIIFIDTPGVFGKVEDPVSKIINPKTESVLRGNVDVMVYLVDRSRDRDFEENRTLGISRKFDKPKILAINKCDVVKPDYYPHYKFMEEEFDTSVHISALTKSNVNLLLDAIFEYLPEGEKLVDTTNLPTPLLTGDSKQFLSEIIREKAYLLLRKEVPYTLTVRVDEVDTRTFYTPEVLVKSKTDEKNTKSKKRSMVPGELTYVRATIITSDDRYKRMIIGQNGRMIKEIGIASRKELEIATNRKFYIDLTVETNPHWMDDFS